MAFEAFAIILFLLAIIFLVIRSVSKLKPLCKCEICKTYLTSSWAMEHSNLSDWYSCLLNKSPTGTIHIHVLGNVITANPANVEYMLTTKFENFPKGKQFASILGDLLGRGIFAVDGDLWKFQRKMASREFGSVSIRSYAFEIVAAEVRTRLFPLLAFYGENREVLDFQDVLRRFSFDNICKFSFGMDPGCLNLSLPASKFAAAFDLASKLSAERAMTASPAVWKVKRLLNIGSEKMLGEAIGLINELAEEMIEQKRKCGGGDASDQSDLLSRFMGIIDDDKLLRDIVISFLLAGRDTIASALTSFFWLLSRHPGVTDRIRAESAQIMEPEQDLPSYQQIRDMNYLTAAIHESMRLFPPVQFDSKFCLNDDTLPDGTFVRKGTRVTYHPYAMGRMDSIWGLDCREFKPERWLEDGVFKSENLFKYPVFQAGPRVCLGKDMALVEMKSVAVALIRAFDIEVACEPCQTPRYAPGLTATVRGGLPVRITDRRPRKD
nr:cytochrome P450 94C1-like [Ipomoea batatas]GMD16051.1 cytochrome P450 94C1-like [Ipomoea batatas]